MTNSHWIDQLQRRVAEVLAQSPVKEVEANMRAMLLSFFSRLDLVTREDFEVQRQVLLRTRERLEQLEARLAEMEREAPGPRPGE